MQTVLVVDFDHTLGCFSGLGKVVQHCGAVFGPWMFTADKAAPMLRKYAMWRPDVDDVIATIRQAKDQALVHSVVLYTNRGETGGDCLRFLLQCLLGKDWGSVFNHVLELPEQHKTSTLSSRWGRPKNLDRVRALFAEPICCIVVDDLGQVQYDGWGTHDRAVTVRPYHVPADLDESAGLDDIMGLLTDEDYEEEGYTRGTWRRKMFVVLASARTPMAELTSGCPRLRYAMLLKLGAPEEYVRRKMRVELGTDEHLSTAVADLAARNSPWLPSLLQVLGMQPEAGAEGAVQA